MAPPPAQEVYIRSHRCDEAATHVVFDLVHRLLQTAEAESGLPEDWLPRLAEAFAAAGAGLTGFRDGTPFVRQRVAAVGGGPQPLDALPWEVCPELLARRRAPRRRPARTPDG